MFKLNTTTNQDISIHNMQSKQVTEYYNTLNEQREKLKELIYTNDENPLIKKLYTTKNNTHTYSTTLKYNK